MILRGIQSRRLTVITLAGLVLAGGQAWAGESPWYVAARFGESSVDARLGSRHPKRLDDAANAAVVEVGYAVNRFLAVEFGYHDLGRHAGWGSPCVQTDDACIERLAALELCVEGFDCSEVLVGLEGNVDGFSLALVPIWPLGDRLSLRGKAGLIGWDADVAIAPGSFFVAAGSPFTRRGELFSSEDLLAGLGLHYSFPNGLGLQLQHETFDLDAGTTSFGVSWRF